MQSQIVCPIFQISNKTHEGIKDDDPQYFSGVVFGQQAENVSSSLTKGMRVIIVGKLNYSTWEDQQGGNRSKVSIVIDEIGPALKWATASVDSGSSGSSDMPKARDNFEENEAPF